MVKGIKRFIPVLCCIVILISCMVVPASAISNSVMPEDDLEPKVAPYLTGSCFYTTARSYDDEEKFGTSFGLPDVSRNSSDEFLSAGGIVLNRGVSGISEPSEWNLYQYIRVSETQVNGSFSYRLHERYRLVEKDSQSSELFPWSVTFAFNDFGGYWNKDFIRTLFYVHGSYSFIVEFSAYSVQDNKLLSTKKSFSGTSNGAQSVLYGSWMNIIEEELDLSPGDPFYFADFRVMIPWGLEGQELVISRACDFVGAFGTASSSDATAVYVDYPVKENGNSWPVVNQSLFQFLNNNGLITGPGQSYLEGGDITQFLAGSASSVLDAPLFGGMTLGGILAVILAVAIVFWLLKFFAGG